MTKQLGICTRYYQHELAYAAVHVADDAREHGVAGTIFARPGSRPEVTPYWDQRIVKDRHAMFHEWAYNCSRILWLDQPTLAELEWTEAAGVESLGLVLSDGLHPNNVELYRRLDVLISPYACTTQIVKQVLRSRSVVELPWDVPIPITKKCVDPAAAGCRICVPLVDSQAARVAGAIFEVLSQLLQRHPCLTITITCGCNWTIKAKRALRSLSREYPSQVRICQMPNLLQRLMLYSQHDITLWAAQWEGLATVGLASLCAGTPVIAWDIEPHSEYLKDGTNALLVPCDVRENWCRAVEAVPDYSKLLEATSCAVEDSQFVRELQANTDYQLADRKEQFRKGWAELLG